MNPGWEALALAFPQSLRDAAFPPRARGGSASPGLRAASLALANWSPVEAKPLDPWPLCWRPDSVGGGGWGGRHGSQGVLSAAQRGSLYLNPRALACKDLLPTGGLQIRLFCRFKKRFYHNLTQFSLQSFGRRHFESPFCMDEDQESEGTPQDHTTLSDHTTEVPTWVFRP